MRQDALCRTHGPSVCQGLVDGPCELITVACHEDLTGSDLVGRYLLLADETVWVDGPLTQAVRRGALCYLDEIVEARKDTTVLIHPLSDHRRMLPIEKRGEIVACPRAAS